MVVDCVLARCKETVFSAMALVIFCRRGYSRYLICSVFTFVQNVVCWLSLTSKITHSFAVIA